MPKAHSTDVLNTPEEQQRAHCTSINVAADKSNYWIPQLYFINANGTDTLLKHNTIIYYEVGNGGTDEKVVPFPPGFRMISGSAQRRAPGAIENVGLAIQFYHFGPATNKNYFPNGTHQSTMPDNNMIVTAINFPRCGWANQSLDSDDHFSHMTWPIHGVKGEWVTNGRCPESHPIMYPQVFIETFWPLLPYMKDEWNTTGPNVILANGDVTGITYHADFVSRCCCRVVD